MLLSPRDLRIKGEFGKINSSGHSSRRHQGSPGAQETGIPPVGIAPRAPQPGLVGWKAELEPRVSIWKESRMTRSEQQHNNKPQRKQRQGSESTRTARAARVGRPKPQKPPGRCLESESPPLEPQKRLSPRDSCCHPSPSLPRSWGALPREHFLGNTCRGRSPARPLLFNRPQHRLPGSHRAGIPRGTGKPPAPPSSEAQTASETQLRAWMCCTPSQRGPGAAPVPAGPVPAAPDPRPPDSSAPSPSHPGRRAGLGGVGAAPAILNPSN